MVDWTSIRSPARAVCRSVFIVLANGAQADDEAAKATPHMHTPSVDSVMTLMRCRLLCRQRVILTNEVVRCGWLRILAVIPVQRAEGLGGRISLRKVSRTPIP